MGIEVLIFEKSTLSRRDPFDTLGIYACPFRKPMAFSNFAIIESSNSTKLLTTISAANQTIRRRMLARQNQPHGEKNYRKRIRVTILLEQGYNTVQIGCLKQKIGCLKQKRSVQRELEFWACKGPASPYGPAGEL